MFVTFITAYLDLDPIFPDPPACWTPPEFEKVEEYCFELCIQCREIAPFGTYDNQSLQISLDGRVTCYGDGDYDLVGERILKCCLGFRVNKVIEIVVLGSINDTGTELLLDKEGKRLALPHTKCCRPLLHGNEVSGGARHEKGLPETKLEFHEEYDEAIVECYGKLI